MSESKQGYEKLIVWQNAYNLRRLVYEVTKSFPKIEYRRIVHMRDSARSTKQNIQEGYKRASRKEYIQFLTIAQGSLSELIGDIKDCLDDGFISQQDFKDIDSLARKTDYLFYRLIKALRKKSLNPNNPFNPLTPLKPFV